MILKIAVSRNGVEVCDWLFMEGVERVKMMHNITKKNLLEECGIEECNTEYLRLQTVSDADTCKVMEIQFKHKEKLEWYAVDGTVYLLSDTGKTVERL